MFYVLLATAGRAARARGAIAAAPQPKLDTLLPLVALGDGGRRGRAGHQQPPPGRSGAAAHSQRPHARRHARRCTEAAGKTWQQASTQDFGFALGPRINAAGRLADMTIGIECLLTDDYWPSAGTGRRRWTASTASASTWKATCASKPLPWPRGCARTAAAPRRPSACSTPNFTKAWSASSPRASKTGCTAPPLCLPPARPRARRMSSRARAAPSPVFTCAMRWICSPSATPVCCCALAATPWPLAAPSAWNISTRFEQRLCPGGAGVARTPTRSPAALRHRWPTAARVPPVGRGRTAQFAKSGARALQPPTFSEDMEIVSQRLVGEKHLKLQLRHQGEVVDGIWFGRTEPLARWVAPGLSPGHQRMEGRAQGAVSGRGGAAKRTGWPIKKPPARAAGGGAGYGGGVQPFTARRCV